MTSASWHANGVEENPLPWMPDSYPLHQRRNPLHVLLTAFRHYTLADAKHCQSQALTLTLHPMFIAQPKALRTTAHTKQPNI
jgi:hypothetical protein